MKNIHKLTEGAIILAVFSVLLLLTIFVPIVGIATNLFLALPFMLFAAKNDGKSTLVFLVSAILISFIVGNILALPLALTFGSAGAMMGYLIYKQKSRTTIFLAGSFAVLINVVLQYVFSIVFFQIDFIQESINILQQSMNQSFKTLQAMGQVEGLDKIKEQFDSGMKMMKFLIPSLFLMASFFLVFLIQLVSIPIIKRFGVKVGGWRKVSEISLPKSFLWYYLFTMLATMIMQPEEGTYWFWALINLSYMLQFMMIFQGITFIFFFSEKKGAPKALPIIITIFSLALPFLLSIVRILGIIDLGFGLRNQMEKRS